MRVEITKLVDPSRLADELSVALGVEVATSVRQPVPGEQSGVVVILDRATGEEIDGLNLAVIESVIAAHVSPAPRPGPHRRLAEAVEGATTLAGLKDALTEFAQATDPGPGRVGVARRLGRNER